MKLSLPTRPATPHDIAECIVVRGQTRENAVTVERLAAVGVTLESWRADVESGTLPGFVCEEQGRIVGYCFGDVTSGEIVVLALLPQAEHQGLGRALLAQTVALLQARGFTRLFLGCAADPAVRSHGFYRHLGWQPTGEVDTRGDEILELVLPVA